MGQLDLGGLDPDEIGGLMRLLASTDVDECQIEQGEYEISIRRVPLPLSEPGFAAAERESVDGDDPLFVPSPAVGVFHRSGAQSDPREVEEGSKVKAGEAVGVIEVMGVPHPVRVPKDCVLGAFAVEDGEPVEYGQPIVEIRE